MNVSYTHFLQEEYIPVKKTSVLFGWVYVLGFFFYFYFIKLQGEEKQSFSVIFWCISELLWFSLGTSCLSISHQMAELVQIHYPYVWD